jgi:hypothetical protein
MRRCGMDYVHDFSAFAIAAGAVLVSYWVRHRAVTKVPKL